MSCARAEVTSLLYLRRVACGYPATSASGAAADSAASGQRHHSTAPSNLPRSRSMLVYPTTLLRDMSEHASHVVALRGVDVVERSGKDAGAMATPTAAATIQWLTSQAAGNASANSQVIPPVSHPLHYILLFAACKSSRLCITVNDDDVDCSSGMGNVQRVVSTLCRRRTDSVCSLPGRHASPLLKGPHMYSTTGSAPTGPSSSYMRCSWSF